jgi:hypothetical protein
MKHLPACSRLSALLALGLLGTSAAVAQKGELYGITFFNNELIKVDAATGSGSLVASLSEPISPYGIAFRGSDLYTFDANADRIRGVNRTTGSLAGSFDIGVGDLLGEGDLAFRADGMGFLSSALTPDFDIANDLFRFDLNTGTSVRLGTTDVTIDAMAFWDNTLYAIGQEANATLYTVDQETAALTAVGLLGLELSSPFSGLTFGADGSLFGAINDRLYSIDRLSGVAIQLDPDVLDIGYASVSGLAYAPATPSAVPDAGSYEFAFGASLLLGIGRILRRRKSKSASLMSSS